MRTIHAVVLVGALGAAYAAALSDTRAAETSPPSAQAPPHAEECDPAPVVTITIDENQAHPSGKGKCDVMSVEPDPVVVCDDGAITWVFDNQCARKVKAKIGKRTKVFPKHTLNEPLTTNKDRQPSPYPVPPNTKAKLKEPVKPGALLGRYKYDIAGDGEVSVDPELEVRKGGGGPAPTPRPPSLPSPLPSPRQQN